MAFSILASCWGRAHFRHESLEDERLSLSGTKSPCARGLVLTWCCIFHLVILAVSKIATTPLYCISYCSSISSFFSIYHVVSGFSPPSSTKPSACERNLICVSQNILGLAYGSFRGGFIHPHKGVLLLHIHYYIVVENAWAGVAVANKFKPGNRATAAGLWFLTLLVSYFSSKRMQIANQFPHVSPELCPIACVQCFPRYS